MSETPNATPLSDLRASALRHYDEAATAAHCWMSVIPRAINAYYDALEAADTPSPSPTTTAPAPHRLTERQKREKFWKLEVAARNAPPTAICRACDRPRREHPDGRSSHWFVPPRPSVAPPAPTVAPRDEPQHEGRTAKAEPAAPNQPQEPLLKGDTMSRNATDARGATPCPICTLPLFRHTVPCVAELPPRTRSRDADGKRAKEFVATLATVLRMAQAEGGANATMHVGDVLRLIEAFQSGDMDDGEMPITGPFYPPSVQ